VADRIAYAFEGVSEPGMPDLHQDVIKAYVIVLYIGSCKRLPGLLFVCLQRKINISLLQYG